MAAGDGPNPADGSRAVAGIFRCLGDAEDFYLFRPRGLDGQRRYRVTLDNYGASREVEALELMLDGLVIRLPSPMTSELLLFETLE